MGIPFVPENIELLSVAGLFFSLDSVIHFCNGFCFPFCISTYTQIYSTYLSKIKEVIACILYSTMTPGHVLFFLPYFLFGLIAEFTFIFMCIVGNMERLWILEPEQPEPALSVFRGS